MSARLCRRVYAKMGWRCLICAFAAAVIAAMLAACSGTPGSANTPGTPSSPTSPGQTGGATGGIQVTITDPPSCEVPNGNFEHVYVTIRSVQANISATATDSSSGWQELVPQLNTQPMQIDLFGAGTNACLLATLGSNTTLPIGNYQQIRLLLVANDGGGGPVPVSDACGSQGYNCVVLSDGSVHELQLSSQANTGLKIPPGQILGGPIIVEQGEDVDLNIDFNACASIVQQGNGQFHLKPVLTAGEVSTNNTGISGQVIDGTTGVPISGGTVLVALERQDSTGADVIFLQTAADSSGTFNFCPLPAGATFDVVAAAISGSGVAYNATIVIGVASSTNIGAIPLTAESGTPTGPATLQGFVTASTGSAAASIDVTVSALQTVTVSGSTTLSVTIPAEGNSTSNISLVSNSACPATAPLNTDCGQYSLTVPASNPRVGTFSGGKLSYAAAPGGTVFYTVRAQSFIPLSGGTPICNPSLESTSADATNSPLRVTPGTTTNVKETDFSSCAN